MGVGGFLKTVAPWIGATLEAGVTGNVPALVNIAAKAVSAAIGKDVKADPDAIEAAVNSATPDQIITLRQQDQAHAEKMQAMGYEHIEDLLKIDADDRASARDREVKTGDRVTPRILAFGGALAFVVIVVALIRGWGKIEAAFAGVLVGNLSNKVDLVYAYYFGSSAGSERKTELLAQAGPIPK